MWWAIIEQVRAAAAKVPVLPPNIPSVTTLSAESIQIVINWLRVLSNSICFSLLSSLSVLPNLCYIVKRRKQKA